MISGRRRLLIIFDVDGTLTKTSAIDAQCFAKAFTACFGARLPSKDWSWYRHATDQGIFDEASAAVLGRPPTAGELSRFRERFFALLRSALPPSKAKLQVPGAQDLLDSLRDQGHEIALATGCWEESARLKLERARLDCDTVHLSSSDGECDRSRIIASAIQRMRAQRSAVVYVGDGPWDVYAARRLGLKFVGLDYAQTGRLRALGVDSVLRDFADQPRVFAMLDAVAGSSRISSYPRGP